MENQSSLSDEKPQKKKPKKYSFLGLIIIAIFIIIVIVAIAGGDDNSSSKQTVNQEWYSGGTLHQTTIADWKVASNKNKLATSADMMAAVDNTVSMDELRIRAEALKKCIDETVIDESKVAEVGAMCIILSGYDN